MTSNVKTGTIQNHTENKDAENEKGESPGETRKKSSERLKWERTQNKAGASAGEDNP